MYSGITLLYSTITTNKKERLSTILEPLQSMIQLALLSFTPIGTKLSIYENLLHIQFNNWNQSLIRNYYNDSKDDLYYLFNVINRFNKFYVNNSENEEEKILFKLLNELAYNGLFKLIQTYTYKNNINIVNTLNMYKSMIKNPKLCEAYDIEKKDNIFNNENNDNNNDNNTDNNSINNINTNNNNQIEIYSNNILNNEINNLNIDNIFINIKTIYNDYHYRIIYNFFQMLKNDSINYLIYIEGINTLFTPINNQIKAWINTKLSC
jgi:hypothetical protein